MTDGLPGDDGPESPAAGSGSRQERLVMRADPICGNCGKPFSQHYHEHEEFCFPDTTGDIFSDEPREDWVLGQMADRYPHLYEEIELEWKRANGHA